MTDFPRADSDPLFTDFIARRGDSWRTLADLVARASTRRGLRRLSPAELRRLGPLYQQTAADLAFTRLRGGPDELEEFLNDLTARAHGLLYADRRPGARRLAGFLLRGFPALLRQHSLWIGAAWALLLLGAVLGAALTASDPRFGPALLGQRAEEVSFYKDIAAQVDGTQASMSAGLMQNNIRVAILAFAAGVLLAVPTLLVLFLNGLPLGALAVVQQKAGYGIWMWSFVAPHGVIELTAICVAGAAGMRIGAALVAPGERSRADALKAASGAAIRLLVGAAAMLVLAGLTEAFVSPSTLPHAAKFAYSAMTALLLAGYWRLGAKTER